MNTDDFIKLPATEAAWLYRHHRDAGNAEEASRLHQAYFEAHRVKLSSDRQIAEAAPATMPTAATPARPDKPPLQRERSKVRLVGALLSATGLMIGLFAAAAGIGPASLVISAGCAGSGMALWMVGVLEDRLISIHEELGALAR